MCGIGQRGLTSPGRPGVTVWAVHTRTSKNGFLLSAEASSAIYDSL